MPILDFDTQLAAHTVYLGGGAMVYQSTSSATATSDFLNIHITHEELHVAPLANMEYRFRKRDTDVKLLPDSYAFKVSAFKTGKFFTAFTSASLRYEF